MTHYHPRDEGSSHRRGSLELKEAFVVGSFSSPSLHYYPPRHRRGSISTAIANGTAQFVDGAARVVGWFPMMMVVVVMDST